MVLGELFLMANDGNKHFAPANFFDFINATLADYEQRNTTPAIVREYRTAATQLLKALDLEDEFIAYNRLSSLSANPPNIKPSL